MSRQSLALGLLVACVLWPLSAPATDYQWANPGGGPWWTDPLVGPTNWSPDTGVPMTPLDTATLPDLLVNYTVFLNADPSIRAFSVWTGAYQVSIDLGGHVLEVLGPGCYNGGLLRLYGSAPGALVAKTDMTNDVGAVLDLCDGAALALDDGTLLTNSGAIRLLGGRLLCAGSVSLGGSGLMTVAGGVVDGPGGLTHGPGHIIEGGGLDVLVAFTNFGTVRAVGGSPLRFETKPVRNDGAGVITADGGDLTFRVRVDQAPTGMICAAHGGTVWLAGGATVAGGVLTTDHLSRIEVAAGTTNTIRDVANGGRILVRDSATLELGGTTITNNGLIVVGEGFPNLGWLYALNDVVVAGNGAIVLDGGTVTSAGARLTNGAAHTICGGYGVILANLTNYGLVSGDVAGGVICIMGEATNYGTMEGTAGGKLTIKSPVNQVPGGVIRATAGGVVYLESAIDQTAGGTVMAAGGDVWLWNGQIFGGSIVSTPACRFEASPGTNNTIGDLANAARVLVAETAVLNLAGTIVNAGAIEVTGGPAGKAVLFGLGATLSGTGEVILKDAAVTGSAAPLVNSAGHTIRGGSSVIDCFLVNEGWVVADSPGAPLVLTAVPKLNSGIMTAAGGGTLDIAANVMQNTGGVIRADNESTVNIVGAAVDQTAGGTLIVNGGQVLLGNASVAGGTVEVSAGVLTTAVLTSNLFQSLEVVNNGTVGVGPGSVLSLDNVLVNNDGAVLLTCGGPGYAFVNVLTDSVLTGSGAVFLEGGQVVSQPGAVLVNEQTICGSAGWIDAALDNRGAVVSDAAGGQITLQGAPKTNSGRLAAAPGAVLNITTTVNQAPTGETAADSGTVRLTNAAISGGTITVSHTGLLHSTDGSMNYLSGLAVQNFGEVRVPAASTLALTDVVFKNVATVNLEGGALGNAWLGVLTDSEIWGSGQIVLSSGGIFSLPGSTLTNTGNLIHGGNGWIYARLLNLGTVRADVPGAEIILTQDPKTNDGVMEATWGSLLRISALVLQGPTGQIVAQPGGTVEISSNVSQAPGAVVAAAGGQVWLNGADVTGGQVVADPAGRLICVEGATNSLADLTLANAGEVRVGAGSVLALDNVMVVNQGAINLDRGPLGLAYLEVCSPIALTDAGSLNMSGGYIVSAAAAELTNDAAHTIRGTGWIDTRLMNCGTLSADVPGNDLVLQNAAKTNFGAMLADGGRLLILGSVRQFDPGFIQALNGGTVVIQSIVSQDPTAVVLASGGDVVMQGGAIFGGWATVLAGSRMICNRGTSSILSGAVVLNHGEVCVDTGAVLQLDGVTVGNAGVVSLTGGGVGPALIDVSADSTIMLGGTLDLDGGAIFSSTGATLTNAAGHTIRGGPGWIDAPLANEGVVSADVLWESLVLQYGPKTNSGLLQATGGGVLELFSPVIQTDSAAISASVASTVNIYGPVAQSPGSAIRGDDGHVRLAGAAVSGGNLITTPAGLISTEPGYITALSNVTSAGTLWVQPGSALRLSNSLVQVAGDTTVNGTLIAEPGAQFILLGGNAVFGTDAGAAGQNLTLNVDGGLALFTSMQHLASLNIASGNVLILVGGGTGLDAFALAIDDTAGRLNVHDGNAVVDYPDLLPSPLHQIRDWIRTGYNAAGGGYWDGLGITSGAARDDPLRLTALGVIDNADPWVGGKADLEGQPLDATSVLVKYTYWGDANLDGQVNSNDYDVIDFFFLFPPGTPDEHGWWNGDFNYDQVINSNDYDLIDYAFLFQGLPLDGGGGPGSVPEPATLGMLALGAMVTSAWRRRASRRAGSAG